MELGGREHRPRGARRRSAAMMGAAPGASCGGQQIEVGGRCLMNEAAHVHRALARYATF